MGLCLRSQNRNATRGTPRSPPAPKSAWRRWKLVLRRLRTPLQNLLRHKGFGLWKILQRRSQAPQISEEHTSELQSRGHLVFRLMLGTKKKKSNNRNHV